MNRPNLTDAIEQRLAVPTIWNSCYDDGWHGEIVPEAFAHPAKVSRALIRRIYQHAFVEGWLVPGDVVVDPFGGIAGTALDAMWNGLTWYGVELEPRFVGLAGENIALWNRRYDSKPGFGYARILQGDSRRLCDVISGARVIVSSPPYAKGLGNGGGAPGETPRGDSRYDVAMRARYGDTPGQLESMPPGPAPALICSSPPYAAISTGAGGLNTKPGADGQQSGRNAASPSQDTDQRYGETAGQLATMREGEALACIVSSPPFSHPNEQPVASQSRLLKEGGYAAMKAPSKMARGTADGNLESMPEGRFDAVVDGIISSPPYEGSLEGKADSGHHRAGASVRDARQGRKCQDMNYSGQLENLGNETGETFWAAARDIVSQCYQILRPGGHAIWIVKDFVRKGKRIPFSDQWQALCEQEGFRLVCRHRAMLVAHHGEQDSIFGGSEQVTTQRKSFFRRLAEKKGSPPIDFEDIVCLERST